MVSDLLIGWPMPLIRSLDVIFFSLYALSCFFFCLCFLILPYRIVQNIDV